MRYRRKRKKLPMEFSKKIMLVAAFINLGVIIFACIMMYKTMDLSPLAYLIPSIAAETATGTGFYYSKAKAENRIKLMKANKVTPTENTFDNY